MWVPALSIILDVLNFTVYSRTSLSLVHDFLSWRSRGGVQGGSPNQRPCCCSHDGFKSLSLPGWFMCIHAPGSLSFVCLLIRPRPGTYCHSTLLYHFGFVLLSRCSALGLPAGIRLVVWVGFCAFLSSERPFGHAHA